MGKKLVHQSWIFVGFLGSKEVVLSFDNPCWYAIFIEQIRKQHATIDPLGIFLRRSAVSVLFLNRSLSCLSCGSRARGERGVERRGRNAQDTELVALGGDSRCDLAYVGLPAALSVCLSACLPACPSPQLQYIPTDLFTPLVSKGGGVCLLYLSDLTHSWLSQSCFF